MNKSKLIIVEGSQGVGKTTITDYIRHTLNHVNLYRLTGTKDSSIDGKEKAKKMYYNLLDYIKKMENLDIDLLFDRTFFTEENYCRLGKKEYTFTDVYEKLLKKLNELDFDIYYITLYLSNEKEYAKRLNRKGKAQIKYAKFSTDSSIMQQNIYLDMSKEIKEKYPKIKVVNIDNSQDIDIVKKKINEILNII